MGLFVKEDGHLQGWLAALLCCWAAYGEDEHPIEKKTKPHISRPVMCNEQPTPLTPMPRHPIRTLAAFKEAEFTEEDRVRPISERRPSIKPLDFGDTSLMSRISLHGRRKSSTTLLSSPKRISIGNPTNFRRLDYSEKQRRSLKPLQLEPVVLRSGEMDPISSSRDVRPGHSTARSTDTLVTSAQRHSYRDSRDTPLERVHQMSATARRKTSPPGAKEDRTQNYELSRVLQSARPTLSTHSSSSSMRSLRRQTPDANFSTPTSSRTSFERSRVKRKRSHQRLASAESKDLDKEILELNTIVEERRAETARPHSPNDLHVPAVAPAMTVRARSETLTDIGSAFSRPLRLDTNCRTVGETVSPIKSRLSRPFTNMPDPNLIAEAGVVRRPSSRLNGWLSTLLSSSTVQSSPSPTQEPFYKCAPSARRRAVSEASLCTAVTEMESPSLTATSSPTSKGHSRTLTAESRMTPISPPSTACASEFDTKETKRKTTEQWPAIIDHPSQVGLAL